MYLLHMIERMARSATPTLFSWWTCGGHVVWWMPLSVSIFRNSRERNSPALSHLTLPTIFTRPSVFEACIDLRLAKNPSALASASDFFFRSLTISNRE